MKVAQLQKYEKEFKLQINEVTVPKINDDEVLVKIKYAAVNPLDSLIGTGSIKLIQNYKLPQTMGNEITGIIKKVGKEVHQFKLEDQIYARLPLDNIGGFAEYISVKASEIALLPKTLDLKSAVAAPLTGLTAIQGMTEILKVKSGKTILIPGGSGSFGQMAIPIAKSLGLEVIVTGNAEAKERTLEAGADRYLDFKTENYWELLSDIDYVIDTRGPSEFEHELSVMKAGGKILSLITGPNKKFAIDNQMPVWKRLLFSAAGKKYDKLAGEKNIEYNFIFVKSNGRQLQELSRIIDDNGIVPAIDPTAFTLDQINEAIASGKSGKTQGKIVIEM